MDNQPAAPAPAATPIETPIVPTTWPGMFGVFKHSKRTVIVNVWPILGLTVLSLLLSGLGGFDSGQDVSASEGMLSLVGGLLSIWTTLALIVLYFAGIRGEKVGFGASLKQSARFYLRSLGATILTVILLGLSLLALIVPFFFVLPRLSLVNYFLVDRNVGVMEAIKMSWNETKGHSLKVWGIIAATTLFAILCIVLVGIYFLFFYQAVFAILYMYMNKSKPAVTASPLAAEPTPAPVDSATPASTSDTEAESVATTEPEEETPTNQPPTPPAAA